MLGYLVSPVTMQTRLQANTDAGQTLAIRNEQASPSRQPTTNNRTLSRGKTRRRNLPKVKTGCLTCKARRVKCDEAKPCCDRCVRYGVTCDGYAVTEARPTSQIIKPTVYRPIIPRNTQPAPQSDVVPPMQKIHIGPRFGDEREARCFRIYLEETARQITGPFKNSLWERLIPQTSVVEPFVRHAVVAIGALSKISKDARRDHEMRSIQSPSCYKTLEYTYALKQYDKALQGMRAAIGNGEHNMRNALIACILVFCFETLQGRLGPAVTHAQSGLMLLHHWAQAHMTPEVPPFMSNAWQEHRIDEDIMDALSGLDLHVLFFIDRRPTAVRHYLIAAGTKQIERMPLVFHDLQEARNCWSLIMRRNCHFVLLALRASRHTELCGPWDEKSESQWEGDANMMPGESLFGTPHQPDPALQGDYISYQEDIRRWNQASAALFECIKESGTVDEKVIYDAFLPEFRTILSLSHFVLPHLIASSKGSALYQFELGIVTSLFLLAFRCRDRVTRKEAFDLMFSAPYREGIWDLAGAGIISNWIAGIEEEGQDENGYIPEHKRVFITACHVDMHKGWVVLACTQRSLEGLVFRKQRMTWR
ncbi:hypothetical protein DL98DRAFT_469441 [Cadophora sp. DSE1049]|nr:hypothetical protein DL98DRAFT_469441 [Cadophora sp. DSE1049]